MALADTASLIVDLSLKGNFQNQMKSASKSLKGFNADLKNSEGRAFRAGQQIGTGIKNTARIAAGAIGLLAANVALGLNSLIKLDDVVTQTNAVLRSTKGAAGENAKAIRDLATKYEDLNATIDDTVIQSGENLLLTFTNIRKQAFEPTLKAALDMNQALGGGEAGLSNTIRILGKALNDPAKGLTALQRVGVRFTDTQKKQIATALKAGDTFKAQGVILAELNKRFGGSFLAGGSTTAGKVAKFKDAIDDLQRVLATALLPVIGKVADGLRKFLADPAVIKGVNDLGAGIAGLFTDANLAAGADFLKGAFETAKAAAPIVTAAAKATFSLVQAAVGLFKSLPPEIQGLAVGAFAINKLTGGLVTNIAGGLISAVLKQLVSGVVNVNGGVVNVNGLPGVGGVTGATGGGLAGAIKSAAKYILPLAIAAFVAEQLLTGPPAPPGTSGAGPAGTASRGGGFRPGGAVPVELSGKTIDDLVDPSNPMNLWLGKIADDVAPIPGTMRAIRSSFHSDLWTLIHATKALDIQKAAKKVGDTVGKGVGNADSTSAVLKALKTQLLHTDDPKTRAVLKAQIARVEHVLPDRKFAARQYAAVAGILKDGKITAHESKRLHSIMAAVKDRGLPAVTKGIRARIDAARASQKAGDAAVKLAVADVKGAVQADTQTLRDKDLSVAITNIVKTMISLRDTVQVRSQATSLGVRQK